MSRAGVGSDRLRRYILTGAPGAGKTAILRELQARGWAVVGEAATDVIARGQARGVQEPWTDSDFISKIAALQRHRQQQLVPTGTTVQFYDRSPWCTLALARYMQLPVTPTLADEIARVSDEKIYQRTVFFVRPLGFIVPSAARRISYRDALKFEAVHEAIYRAHGFDLVDVSAGEVEQRVALIEVKLASEL